MKSSRCKRLTSSLIAFIILSMAEPFSADVYAATPEYPDRPITLVVPYAVGGAVDLCARVLAEGMEKHLKQPVVVVCKPGGGTTIGGNVIATAKPDGYNIGFFAASSSIPEVFAYFYEAPYSSKDFKPISRVLAPVLAITVREDASWNSLKDLVDFTRKNPGVKVGTHGKSTHGYVVMTTVAKAERINFVNVPFDGDSKIVPAILGGHIPVGTPAFPAIKSLIDAKKLKVLAFCIEKRTEFAPEIPTVVELGYKLAFISYLGLFAPKETPLEVIKKIDELVSRITEGQEFRTKIKNMGAQVSYEDTASFEKSLFQYKGNLQTFFKEEGLVK